MQRGHLYSGTTQHPVFADVLKGDAEVRRASIVMIHGGFHTGTAYLATPEGRPGWAPLLASRGHDVYVMDWPGHGRSPQNEDFLKLSLADVGRSLGVLLEAIGPAVILAHSAGGPVAWWAAENYRSSVLGVVGVAPGEPANLLPTLPATEQETLPDDAGHPVYAATDRPAFVDRAFIQAFWANSPRFPHAAFDAYARSIGPESPQILNDRFNIGGTGLCLRQPEALKDLPTLVVTGDCDPRHPAEVDGALAKFLGAEFVWLPDIGISGNGHMLMLEDNSDEIAFLIDRWLAKNGL